MFFSMNSMNFFYIRNDFKSSTLRLALSNCFRENSFLGLRFELKMIKRKLMVEGGDEIMDPEINRRCRSLNLGGNYVD